MILTSFHLVFTAFQINRDTFLDICYGWALTMQQATHFILPELEELCAVHHTRHALLQIILIIISANTELVLIMEKYSLKVRSWGLHKSYSQI